MTETKSGPFDPKTMTEYEQALVAVRSGYTVAVTTPTGKRLEVLSDEYDTVVLDVTDRNTERGDDAHERFKTVLRTKGTEWEVQHGPSDNAGGLAGGDACPIHSQRQDDDSPRGDDHPNDRTPLAHVYDGLSLRAIVFDEREVERYRDDTTLTVSLTAAGECRVDGACSVQGGGSR